jgi:hypothetical protein
VVVASTGLACLVVVAMSLGLSVVEMEFAAAAVEPLPDALLARGLDRAMLVCLFGCLSVWLAGWLAGGL